MWQALALSGDIRAKEPLKRLAAGCRYLWAADGGLDRLLALDLKPDYYLGDDDSLSPAGRAYLEQAGIPRQKFPENKDYTDSNLALLAMLEKEAARAKQQENGSIKGSVERPGYSDKQPGDSRGLSGNQAESSGDRLGPSTGQSSKLVTEPERPGDFSWPVADSRAGGAASEEKPGLASPNPFLPGPSGILMLASLGSRWDHVLANLALAEHFVRPDLPFLFSDGRSFLYVVKGPFAMDVLLPPLAGGTSAKAYYSFLPATACVGHLTLENFRWNLDDVTLPRGISRAISNEAAPEANEPPYFSLGEGVLYLIVSYEDKSEAAGSVG